MPVLFPGAEGLKHLVDRGRYIRRIVECTARRSNPVPVPVVMDAAQTPSILVEYGDTALQEMLQKPPDA
jgi:hypothetical protein